MISIIEVDIPTPLLAAIAALMFAATCLFWLLWLFQRRKRKHPLSPMAWELVDGTPVNQHDLHIYDGTLALTGADYDYIGTMPARFICAHCGGTECISIRMYHHLPSHTMILLSRHKCLRLDLADTVQMKAQKVERPCSRSHLATVK